MNFSSLITRWKQMVLFQVFAALVLIHTASGATVKIFVADKGLVTVTVQGTFSGRDICDNRNPPGCITCNTGSISLYMNGSYIGGADGKGTAFITKIFEPGALPNGKYTFTATAADCKNTSDRDQATIRVNRPAGTVKKPLAEKEGALGPAKVRTTYQYDALGRLTQKKVVVDGTNTP